CDEDCILLACALRPVALRRRLEPQRLAPFNQYLALLHHRRITPPPPPASSAAPRATRAPASETSRIIPPDLHHLLRRPCGDDLVAAFGAEVDQPVGGLDHLRLRSITRPRPASTRTRAHVFPPRRHRRAAGPA